MPVEADALQKQIAELEQARSHAPETVLGRHRTGDVECVRAFLPDAREAWLEPGALAMRNAGGGLFEWRGVERELALPYHIRWRDLSGLEHQRVDPYQFAPQLPHDEIAAFNSGLHRRVYRLLGSHVLDREDVQGTRFAVWAPNATRVSVVGNFNNWDGRRHPMSVRGDSGIWELFIPGVKAGALYKFEIRDRNGNVRLKADPYAFCFELRPRTASVVCAASDFEWNDAEWMHSRADWLRAPMSIYEIHAGAWRYGTNGKPLNYRELAAELIPYLQKTGFTHVEFMPLMEHPLDESWGYQCTGYFAPTARFGQPDDFRYCVNKLHRAGIGVILDWVPGHFPRDDHALANFDGTALYEHADPRRGHTAEWGTLAFNLGRNEVRSFLISSALYWLEEFHIDGLRVDAVAAMLYLDYGRRAGEWLPNTYGGREDLDAVSFLQALNTATHGECPGSFTIAEESTAWPGVSRPVHLGGLGFSMKWNMGWMHDTLEYLHHDPIHRRYHHDRLTFGMLYAFSENYVLPLSHDEVVHGKGSLYARMSGDDWQKHANLRLLFAFQFTWPGKKLLFMGCEFGAHAEWSPGRTPEWTLLEYPRHAGLLKLVADLNRLYREHPALHGADFDAAGFEWIDCHDADNSVITYFRKYGNAEVLVALNFTPVPRHTYRLGVERPGYYREIFNSDAEFYGGSNLGNAGLVQAEEKTWMGRKYSLSLVLPPLAAVILTPETDAL